jgi:hypothetical protein
MEVKPLQPRKALSPILVTLLGIVMEVKTLQVAKAPIPILVTPLGIATVPTLPPGHEIKVSCNLL